MPGASDPPTGSTLFGLLQAPTDSEKWCRFVYRYAPRLLRWCRRWGLQQADAEDVTQDVLTTLAVRLRRFRYDPQSSFRGYLRTLARNAWSDLAKARQRAGRGSGADEVQRLLENAAAADDLTQELNRVFDRELLDEAMARVRLRVQPQTWEAFELLTIQGLSAAEVAGRFGMTTAAVYVAKSRVLAMLRGEVKRLEGGCREGSEDQP
jgi:RNA polymerase sigma-70 factor (ECF subfamily)